MFTDALLKGTSHSDGGRWHRGAVAAGQLASPRAICARPRRRSTNCIDWRCVALYGLRRISPGDGPRVQCARDNGRTREKCRERGPRIQSRPIFSVLSGKIRERSASAREKLGLRVKRDIQKARGGKEKITKERDERLARRLSLSLSAARSLCARADRGKAEGESEPLFSRTVPLVSDRTTTGRIFRVRPSERCPFRERQEARNGPPGRFCSHLAHAADFPEDGRPTLRTRRLLCHGLPAENTKEAGGPGKRPQRTDPCS